MRALDALSRSPRALAQNPILLIPVLIVGAFQLPQLILQSTDPVLSTFVSLGISGLFIFITPFFQGGFIGMADESLNGRTSLVTFVTDGKANYISILVAYLLLLVINFIIIGVLFVVGISGFVLIFSQTEIPGAGFLVGGVFFLLMALLLVLVVFFLQFYGQAIVLDDKGSIDGIKYSSRLVRSNLMSTLGYSVITGLIGGIIGLGYGGLGILVAPESAAIALPQLPYSTGVVLSVVGIAVASIIGAFLGLFSVAFYREISRGRVTEA